MTLKEQIIATKKKANQNQKKVTYSETDVRNILEACEDVMIEELPKGNVIKIFGLRIQFKKPIPKKCNANFSGTVKTTRYKYKVSVTPTKSLKDFARSFGVEE